MINKTPAWQKLLAHKQRLANFKLNDLFAINPQRFVDFSLESCGLLYDFSKQHIDAAVMQDLIQLADTCALKEQMQALFTGKHVNKTEDRPALHMCLRAIDTTAEVKQVRQQAAAFVAAIHTNEYVGVSGKPVKNVISLGIGGSDLGPCMVCEALQHFSITDLKIHFVSNVDGQTLSTLLTRLSPTDTICLVNSKTFTTPETLLNARTVKAWFINNLGEVAVTKQMFAITANVREANAFGIALKNIFTFWDWVGGRYSVWSAVGLSIELMLGSLQFQEFLAGANAMDMHFIHSDFVNNLPVIMALLGIWNINFLAYKTLLIMPYLDGLKSFPAYLQQLEMESNGKRTINEGNYADYMTAPVIWGGVGCNGQHAYMQLLHQGMETIPVDFIMAINSSSKLQEQQDFLLASCLSQSRALMDGVTEEELLAHNPKNLAQAKMCPGNKPSSTICFPKLTPRVLGSLIALYEHKVFVQGIIWQIQSFDQWGVELGKKITKNILPMVREQDLVEQIDSSTAGLLKYIKKNRT